MKFVFKNEAFCKKESVFISSQDAKELGKELLKDFGDLDYDALVEELKILKCKLELSEQALAATLEEKENSDAQITLWKVLAKKRHELVLEQRQDNENLLKGLNKSTFWI